MPEQREYHIEEIRAYVAGGLTPARVAELEREGWVCPVIQLMQRLDGSTCRVLIMSRPHKPEKICLECGQPFRVRDQRQKYCSISCGNRLRYRRWYGKKRLKLKGESEEPDNGC